MLQLNEALKKENVFNDLKKQQSRPLQSAASLWVQTVGFPGAADAWLSLMIKSNPKSSYSKWLNIVTHIFPGRPRGSDFYWSYWATLIILKLPFATGAYKRDSDTKPMCSLPREQQVITYCR